MARQTAKVRTTSKLVATRPACAPLRTMYQAAVASKPRSWTEIEDAFVSAMEAFDANVASGIADIGDLQNGKGDFFNDLLALLLENCAEVDLYSRGGVPGFVFPKHNLDVTFPNSGVVRFVLEAKAVGTPRHPLSPKQKPIGRAGSADLAKRVKEVAFKSIDLKAEYGRIMSMRGMSPSGPGGGDLTTWLRGNAPSAYLFIAARVINERDFDAAIGFAHTAAQVQDGVGLFCFSPESATKATTYRKVPVPTELSLDRVLHRACLDLGALAREGEVPVSRAPVGPAAEAGAAASDAVETENDS